jgi:hypothetical protein
MHVTNLITIRAEQKIFWRQPATAFCRAQYFLAPDGMELVASAVFCEFRGDTGQRPFVASRNTQRWSSTARTEPGRNRKRDHRLQWLV